MSFCSLLELVSVGNTLMASSVFMSSAFGNLSREEKHPLKSHLVTFVAEKFQQ